MFFTSTQYSLIFQLQHIQIPQILMQGPNLINRTAAQQHKFTGNSKDRKLIRTIVKTMAHYRAQELEQIVDLTFHSLYL